MAVGTKLSRAPIVEAHANVTEEGDNVNSTPSARRTTSERAVVVRDVTVACTRESRPKNTRAGRLGRASMATTKNKKRETLTVIRVQAFVGKKLRASMQPRPKKATYRSFTY